MSSLSLTDLLLLGEFLEEKSNNILKEKTNNGKNESK